MSRSILKRIFCSILFCSLNISFVHAQSAQQIEQFKKLPKSQQQQLARQLGIDMSQFSSATNTRPEEIESETYPRGTQFDQQGNPLDEQTSVIEDSNENDELKLYGQELFANGPASFTSLANLPVPADYIIGTGDTLSVQIFGKENEEYSLPVGRDGKIVIPKFGPLSVASKTFSQAQAYISEKIKQQIIGVDVSVRLAELKTMRIFVLGEAYKPGAYTISSLSTVTHALFASGGVTDIASLRNIQLKRQGKTINTLDLYDLMHAGDTQNDVSLIAGDAVFIPAIQNSVRVDGQVRRPAIYELKGEEVLADVLKLAGGALANGYKQAVRVKRFANGQQIQLTVDTKDTKLVINNGDDIFVPEISPTIADSILLIGAVARPGNYQWKHNMAISDFLSEPEKELLDNADLSYVIVLRENFFKQQLDVLQVDLTRLSSANDIVLQKNDKILVFSMIENESFGDLRLEDLAFTSQELEEKEQELWQQRIKQKLFWRSVGLDEEFEKVVQNSDDDNAIQTQSIVSLSENEREKALEFKDSTFFSRKRLLAPVIAKLRDQARFGKPLKLVEVAGEVRIPGLYPLTKGANITDLVKAAGGLTEASYRLKSEITRTEIDSDGKASVKHIEFKPFELLTDSANTEKNITLKSKDRINIFSTPSWQEDLTVTVKGEVVFPGIYTIKRGETLNDLLTRVGGTTDYGDLDSAIFTRESLKVKERENLKALAEELRKQIASESLRKQSGAGGMISYDQSKKLLADLIKTEAIGRLVLDVDRLLSEKNADGVILEDGDILHVPSRRQSVNVIGEVYVPTSHLFSSEQHLDDYITKSGGFKSLADTERVYIIRANGSVVLPNSTNNFWFSASAGKVLIKPGDTIVVPFDTDNVDGLTLWTNATQIIYQLAVAVAAIGSL